MAYDKKPSNLWEIEGRLGKKEWIKEGTSRNGKPYMIHSVSVYDSKDKETDEVKYLRVTFFVPEKDHSVFKRFDDGAKIRLRGKPDPNGSYINKDTGEIVHKLAMKVNWDNYYELIDQPQLQSEPEYDPGEEPF